MVIKDLANLRDSFVALCGKTLGIYIILKLTFDIVIAIDIVFLKLPLLLSLILPLKFVSLPFRKNLH